jgi:hypothetical protein
MDVLNRYFEAFGEDFSVIEATDIEGALNAAEEAIKRGNPLTTQELSAYGIYSAPDGALI